MTHSTDGGCLQFLSLSEAIALEDGVGRSPLTSRIRFGITWRQLRQYQ